MIYWIVFAVFVVGLAFSLLINRPWTSVLEKRAPPSLLLLVCFLFFCLYLCILVSQDYTFSTIFETRLFLYLVIHTAMYVLLSVTFRFDSYVTVSIGAPVLLANILLLLDANQYKVLAVHIALMLNALYQLIAYCNMSCWYSFRCRLFFFFSFVFYVLLYSLARNDLFFVAYDLYLFSVSFYMLFYPFAHYIANHNKKFLFHVDRKRQ